METIHAKEKFVFNMLRPEERSGKITTLYIVYKTIEANTGITINQLKWLLDTEYMLQNDVVAAAVAALTSKSLFNCVSRWQPPKTAGQPRTDAVHLRIRRDSTEFNTWYEESCTECPELSVFVPPIFSNKPATSPSATHSPQPNTSAVSSQNVDHN